MSSQRDRIDAVRKNDVDARTNNADDTSGTHNERQDSVASIRTDSTAASSLEEAKEATRRKKKIETNKLIKMIESHGESPLSDEERRRRFDDSFETAAEGTERPKASPRSKKRGGIRDIKVNQRLSEHNQTLLAKYYEKTEISDPRSNKPEVDLIGPAFYEPEVVDNVHDNIKEKRPSLIEETKHVMGIQGDDNGRDSCSDLSVDDEARGGIGGNATTLVEDLSAKAGFSFNTRQARIHEDVARRRACTREDIDAARATNTQRRPPRRRWQHFEQPGAVQMEGRAFGAPPRPLDSKPTVAVGLSQKSQAEFDIERLLEEGVMLTADGPLVQAAPVTPDECAPRAWIDVAYAESKPASFRDLLLERSFRWRLAGICLLIACMTMLISVAGTQAAVSDDDTNNNDPQAPPTPAPTFIRIDLLADLTPISGIEALSTPSSPQRRAVGWLSTFDKSGLEASDLFFLQRYVMVVLYFAMGGEQWLAKEKWLNPKLHECDWSTAIHCEVDLYDNHCIKSLDLSRIGLKGSIPPEIGYLDSVASINLAKNSLNGTLPSELFNLSELTELVLNSNQLSSEIPSSISNATFLDFLDLSNNAFEGSIPEELYDLTHLRTLDLSSNSLTGTISSRLKDLHQLDTLDMRSNSLEGTIPVVFTPECSLALVRLDDNMLTGSLPEFSGALVQLQELSVSNNFLDGTMPSLPEGDIAVVEALSDQDFRLQKLDISHNEFNGFMPDFFGLIPSLREFDFSGNAFVGTFPSIPGMWRSLEAVAGGDNQLTGVLPSAFPPTLTLYDFHGNFFVGGIPPQLATQLPRVELLSLARNPLGGPIPSSLGNNPHLVGLDLRLCGLIGTIPDLTSLASLGTIDVRENSLSGTIPAGLGTMTTLTSLMLASNRLTGTVPPQIGNLSNLGVLLLQDNELTGSLPVTLTNLGDLVDFQVILNPMEGTVPEGLCTIIEDLSVDNVGCNLQCNCCSDANSCGTA